MKTAPGPESPCCQALVMLLRTADTVWNGSRLFLERWKISPSQFNVLNLLHLTRGGISQSELGRQLIMHRSNVTGLVDRLEAQGFVSRKEVELDRRAYSVELTRQGAALVEQILPAYYAAADRLWRVVPAERLGTTIADLQAVAENAVRIVADVQTVTDSKPVARRRRKSGRSARN